MVQILLMDLYKGVVAWLFCKRTFAILVSVSLGT